MTLLTAGWCRLPCSPGRLVNITDSCLPLLLISLTKCPKLARARLPRLRVLLMNRVIGCPPPSINLCRLCLCPLFRAGTCIRPLAERLQNSVVTKAVSPTSRPLTVRDPEIATPPLLLTVRRSSCSTMAPLSLTMLYSVTNCFLKTVFPTLPTNRRRRVALKQLVRPSGNDSLQRRTILVCTPPLRPSAVEAVLYVS